MLPPPLTRARTSYPSPSTRDSRSQRSFAEEKFTLYSVKSMDASAACFPASKSAIVIELAAKMSATFGLSPLIRIPSRTASTFAKPLCVFLARSSARFMSSSDTACCWRVSTRETLKPSWMFPRLPAFLKTVPPTVTRLPFSRSSRSPWGIIRESSWSEFWSFRVS